MRVSIEATYVSSELATYIATGNDIEGGTPLAAIPIILGLDNNLCPLLCWYYGGEARHRSH